VDLSEFLQPVLAVDSLRYVGEPVAVVLAEDPYIAEDAAEKVVLKIEDLTAVTDPKDGTTAADFELSFGNVADAFKRADVVVEISIDIGRHSAIPLEPRSLLVDFNGATGGLEIFGMTKVPVFNQGVLAELLGIDETLIHIHAVDAGGGFGVRGEFYPEDFLIPWLAIEQRRPIKWTEDRREHLLAVNHSRQQFHRIAVALTAGGQILGLHDDVLHDNGAYCRTHGIIVPELTLAMLPGPYRVPAYRGHIRVALTNKTPCGTYRAPGRFEGTTAREQLLDVAADQLGIDRIELRRRNLLTRPELPLDRPMSTLGTDVVLDRGDYIGLLDKAMVEADRLGYNAEVDRLRSQGHRAGLGVAMFLEKSGLGPFDTADVKVSRSGSVHVYSGGTSFGQGIETVLAQIAADVFGISSTVVSVVNGDTQLQPYGAGSWASRSTVVSGSAVRLAAQAVLERAITIASRILEIPEADLEFRDGSVAVRNGLGGLINLSEIAKAADPGSVYLWAGEPAGLSARRRFEVDHMTYPYGVHLAVVEVDAQTGGVQVRRYLVAYEIGNAINPDLVAGQLRGGVAQGLGGAMMEEFLYDQCGYPMILTLNEYVMPTANEVPSVDLIVTEDCPSAGNPLGAKGAGEGGIAAVGAAIASAVRDALNLDGPVVRLPLTPTRVSSLIAEQAERGRHDG
jgi:carbon-monoxide dehydrogenase large subunit/6-hydroxypseudooxynicotine dehydrogenase subunit gamma